MSSITRLSLEARPPPPPVPETDPLLLVIPKTNSPQAPLLRSVLTASASLGGRVDTVTFQTEAVSMEGLAAVFDAYPTATHALLADTGLSFDGKALVDLVARWPLPPEAIVFAPTPTRPSSLLPAIHAVLRKDALPEERPEDAAALSVSYAIAGVEPGSRLGKGGLLAVGENMTSTACVVVPRALFPRLKAYFFPEGDAGDNWWRSLGKPFSLNDGATLYPAGPAAFMKRCSLATGLPVYMATRLEATITCGACHACVAPALPAYLRVFHQVIAEEDEEEGRGVVERKAPECV